MGSFNTLDYVILVLVMVSAVWGAIKGLVEELSQKFGYVLGFLVALMFSYALIPVFETNLGWPRWCAAAVSYFIFFMAGYIAMKVLGNMISEICKTANVTVFDNLLGFVLGFFESIIIIGLLITLLSHQQLIDFSDKISGSFMCNRLIMPVFNWLASLVHKAT